LIHQPGGVPSVPRRPIELTASPEQAELVGEIGCAGLAPKPGARKPMRAVVRILANLPVTQVEIEVIASLLDDWESLFPIAPEATE
jgi:hypothetical protein